MSREEAKRVNRVLNDPKLLAQLRKNVSAGKPDIAHLLSEIEDQVLRETLRAALTDE